MYTGVDEIGLMRHGVEDLHQHGAHAFALGGFGRQVDDEGNGVVHDGLSFEMGEQTI
jgi:hypothetical protein